MGTVGRGFIGLWLLAVASLELAGGQLGRRLAWTGIVAGAGYVLLTVSFLLVGPEHLMTALGGLVAVVAYRYLVGSPDKEQLC